MTEENKFLFPGEAVGLPEEDNNQSSNIGLPESLIALIDADSFSYVISYNNREESEEVMVVLAVDTAIKDILTMCKTRRYIGFIAGNNKTIRYDLASIKPYKGTRTTEAPEWLVKWGPVIKKRLIEEHKFFTTDRIESDDALAILSNSLGIDQTILCSNDKDMKQIPGYHYYMPKREIQVVSPEEAAYNFWAQMITGDGTDNIMGIPRKGEAAVPKLIGTKEAPFCDPDKFQQLVFQEYINVLGPFASKTFTENYMLLKLRTSWPFNYPKELIPTDILIAR